MAKEKVLYEVQGEWVWITLNYPERLNALDFEAYGLLRELLARYQADASLRVAILHGAGGRAFSTGSDMRSDGWVDDASPVQVTEEPDDFRVTKPLIAAIDGYCLGGGLEWALRCDFRIATSRSSFGLPEPRNSTLAGFGLHHLSRVIPAGEALYMQLTGERIDAERALRNGLVQEVVEPEALRSRVEEIAERILACAPLAVEAIKQTVWFNLSQGVGASYENTRHLAQRVSESEDARMGTRAFAEKRTVDWKGR